VKLHCYLRVLLLLGISIAAAGAMQNADPSPTAAVVIAPNGTVRVTRIVPVPTTVSPEAQKEFTTMKPSLNLHETLEQRRTQTEKWQAETGEKWLKIYSAKLATDTIAGVPVRVVTPMEIAPEKASRVLINLHGGGFRVDSGSLSETIPIASLTGTKVISVLYRLTPENRFPAAVDDVVAVYKELLKTYKPSYIGIYGTSAGAFLTAEVAAELRKLGLTLPGVLGIFAGGGDVGKAGDSGALFDMMGLTEALDPPDPTRLDTEYNGSTDVRDPVLSPIYSDLKGFSPTLFVTSTRDLALSSTVILHRAFLRAGVEAQLVVFEALPHAFWNNPELPESKEAVQLMATFFVRHLGN
jgi:monoterpene epsilon-lactone hydrolase